MLNTIIICLLILWLMGAFVISIPAVGSFVHVLLAVLLILVVLRVLQGRRSLS